MKTILTILLLCSVAVSQQATPAQSSKPRSLAIGNGTGWIPLGDPEHCGNLIINLQGKTAVTINCKDGSVTYGEGFDKDSGAKAFWEAVSQLYKPCLAGAPSEPTRKPASEKPEKKLP